MPDQNSASSEHALMQEITAPLAKLPHDPVPEVANVDFPIVLRGYDRLAVDAYVKRTSQLVAELDASRSPQHAVRRALERVGEEVSGILQRAHETAEQITAQSRTEAEDRLTAARREAETLLADARREAETIVGDARHRLTDLDAETDRIWEERHRIVEDARTLASQLLTMAESAIERFPAEEVSVTETQALAVDQELGTDEEPVAEEEEFAPPAQPSPQDPAPEDQDGISTDVFPGPAVSQDTVPIEPTPPFDHEAS